MDAFFIIGNQFARDIVLSNQHLSLTWAEWPGLYFQSMTQRLLSQHYFTRLLTGLNMRPSLFFQGNVVVSSYPRSSAGNHRHVILSSQGNNSAMTMFT